MVNILLISHGDFASGLLDSVKMLVGEVEDVDSITFEKKMGIDELKDLTEDYLTSVEGPLIVFTDLKGGTPFNVVSILTQNREDTYVFYGMNLPMVVEACILKENLNPKELVETIEKNLLDGIGRN